MRDIFSASDLLFQVALQSCPRMSPAASLCLLRSELDVSVESATGAWISPCRVKGRREEGEGYERRSLGICDDA
jgi:hypothetical protein